MPRNIILIGFMGCGKSTIGRSLQGKLGYPWIDTDEHIEQCVGMSVKEIFAKRGEQAFRELESNILLDMTERRIQHHIISTGGGIIGRQENRKMLGKLGFVVWLVASTQVIMERTARNRDRPLLQTDDPKTRIEALLQERRPLYEETAHISIETHGLDSNEVASGIIESARYFFNQADATQVLDRDESVS
ncbi:MAG: shikimate kinase [Verrucomicrobia bacterium]|nr:MAG: shikimate kinase [Verrucomicrobiota bacterium]